MCVCLVCLGVLWQCSHSEAQTWTHFHALGGWTCGVLSHLALGLLTHCDWDIIRSIGLWFRIKPWLICMSQQEKDHTFIVCFHLYDESPYCVFFCHEVWERRDSNILCLPGFEDTDYEDIHLFSFFTQTVFLLLFSLPDWLLSWADWLAGLLPLSLDSHHQIPHSECEFSEAEWE